MDDVKKTAQNVGATLTQALKHCEENPTGCAFPACDVCGCRFPGRGHSPSILTRTILAPATRVVTTPTEAVEDVKKTVAPSLVEVLALLRTFAHDLAAACLEDSLEDNARFEGNDADQIVRHSREQLVVAIRALDAARNDADVVRGHAESLVDKIIEDLNDRSGLHIDDLDEDAQKEIRRDWIAIVEGEGK